MGSPSRRTDFSTTIGSQNGTKKKECFSKQKMNRYSLILNQSKSSNRKWLIEEVQYLKRTMRKDFSSDGNFHAAIGSILGLAQWFGIMPVAGIKRKSSSHLEFQWKSVRAVYCFIATLVSLIHAGILLWITANNKIEFIQMIPLVFYSTTAYGMFCFGILSKKWPKLMQRWESVEAILPKYRNQKEKQKLANHLKKLALIVLLSALVEHVLNAISIMYFAKVCLNSDDLFKELFQVQLGHLFMILPYSPWIAVVAKVVNIIATFCWNYMDLFVMMIGVGLSTRFRQINEDLQRTKGKQMSEDFWELRRMQYRKLAGLCVAVDDAISQITLLSFSNNLFFISVQLLHSLRTQASLLHAVYFWFSLLFLIARTLAVSLYASKVYDEAKKPIDVLRAVPNWCAEVRRFSEHVINDTIALTGMRFFYLTRKLILTVVGTIITVELVLIQFHRDDEKPIKCQANG